ncbi:MAG: type II secretion system secretin GspD [Sphingomonadales bacterium]
MSHFNLQWTRGLALVLAMLWAGLAMMPAWAQPDGQVLNLRGADIRAFIDDVSMSTGHVFIVDPRVQGNVTVVAHQPVKPADLFQIFLSTLRVHGYTAIPTSTGAYRIVPDETAAQDGGFGPDRVTGDQFVTEVFTLQHGDAAAVVNMLKPIVHRQGQAIASPASNKLIIVDYAANMARVRNVVARLDRDTSQLHTVSLKNIGAVEAADILNDVAKAGSGREQRSAGALSIVPVEAANMLILRGEKDALEAMLPIVARLDEGGRQQGDIRVRGLKHAKAEDLLPLLEQMSGTLTAVGGDGGSARGDRRRASIAVDKGTNALVISAEPAMQQALEAVIRQLDVRRAQVLVEAIIVEVSDTAARELGVQYILSGGEGSKIPFSATNFSNSAPNILAATGALIADREGLFEDDALSGLQAAAVDSLIGANGFIGGFGGETRNGTLFGFILNMLDRDLGSNVLSTPFIMTMNNEPARVLIGQEIPITTGEALGSANINPFRTVERQDVGIQLFVTPQISEGSSIKLTIRQEVSSIIGPVSATSTELILNKREVETVVLADDGEIIVLGGLIEQDEQISVDKVPFLGDIPVLGRAFRSEGKSRARTNLMVFLRPTIVRDVKDVRGVTDRKYNFMRAEELRSMGGGDSNMDMMIKQWTGLGAASEGAAP